MTAMIDPSLPPAFQRDNSLLWQHRALCRLSLPLRTPRGGTWSRETEIASVAMGTDAAAAGETLPLPSGRLLRLLLLHIFTAALRADTAAAAVGPDIASVAAALGLDGAPPLRELQDQLDRLLAARLRVAEGRQAPLSVLDGRAQRGGSAAWRPVLRLTERFFASLRQNAVPLDRAAVTALGASAPALDAYAWLKETLPAAAADEPVLVTWDALQQQFGSGASAATEPFRAAFIASLEAAREVHPAARFTVGPDGVELRHSPALVSVAAVPEPADPVNMDEAQDFAPAVPPEPPLASDEAVEAREAPAPAAPPPELDRVEPPVPPVERRASPEWERNGGRIRLAPVLTGLAQSVWLRRGGDESSATIEVTPGADYHPARRSLLMLEPVILQVAGQLQPRELEEVAAWAAANADLIQDYWDGTIASVFDIAGRVRPVPATRW